MEKPLHGVRPEFRAPPPSPMGSGSDSTENEDELIGFLRRTVRTPTLNLPDKIVPRKKAPTWKAPEIDLRSLNSKEKEGTTSVEMLKSAAINYGCFQIVNHRINMKTVDTVLEMVRKEVLVEEKKKLGMRRERIWGFEIEREEGEEGEEVLWWGGDEREGEEDLKAVFSHGAKMEDVRSRMELIASNIAHILQQDSIISTTMEEKGNNGSFLCLHSYNGSRNNAEDSMIKHEILHMLVRDTMVSRALSLHLCKNASEFHIYSKRGHSSFRPSNDAIIVTIGKQIQAWSSGLYKNVIGKPYYPQKNINSTSIEFLYSHSRNTRISPQNRDSENTISLMHQVIIITSLTLMYHFIVSLFYIS